MNKDLEQNTIVTNYEFSSGILVLESSKGGSIKVKLNGFDLSKLTPDGYEIYLSDSGSECKHKEGRIEVSSKELKNPSFLLTLLHEVGHSAKDEKVDLDRDKEISRELKELSRKNSEKDVLRYIGVLEEYTRLVEKRERQAWLSSIKSLKTVLLESGHDVRKNFANFEEFFSKIIRHYKSYLLGMKYVFEKSGKGTDKQWHDFEAYVDQIFNPHIPILEDEARVFWETELPK